MKKIVSLGATALMAVAVGFVAGELNSNAHYRGWNADCNVAVRGHHIENCGGLGNCWDWCQQQCPWINGGSGVNQAVLEPEAPVAVPVSGVGETVAEEPVQAPAAEEPATTAENQSETPAQDQQAVPTEAPAEPAQDQQTVAAPAEAPAEPAYETAPQENYDTAQSAAGYGCDPDYSNCTPQYSNGSGNGSGHHSGGHHGRRGHH